MTYPVLWQLRFWSPLDRDARGLLMRSENVMRQQEIIERCNRALEAMRDQLPASLHQEAHDLINEHGEWGMAIEFVIDWIGELELEVTSEQFHRIEAAMNGMGWGKSNRMVWLRKHVHIR